MRKLSYFSKGLFVPAITLLYAPAAIAQDDSSDDMALNEIVVTAEKREESLQDTPISISVLGTEQLETRGINSVSDLFTGAVPSVRTANYAGRASTLQISMRGISSGEATQISRDGAIGIYVDGVYLGRVQGLGTEMLDLERIEVLRGPQGTLFGRNAVGGALNIISRRPSGEFDLKQKVGVSNFDGLSTSTQLDLPQFANLSVKLGGIYKKRGGWVSNPAPNEWDFSEYKRWGVRGAVLWEPGSSVDVLYAYDRSTDKSTGNYGQITAIVDGYGPLPPAFSLEPKRVRRARTGVPLEPSVGKNQGHSLTASWDIADSVQIKSISAYRKMSQTQYDQYAGSFYRYTPNGYTGRVSYAGVDQRQYSQELQVVGSTDHLKYALGAFYFDEKASDWADSARTLQYNADGTALSILENEINSPGRSRASHNRVKSQALFGQMTYTPPILDERLHLTGGLRWTYDKKNGDMYEINGAPPSPPLTYKFSSKRVDPAATIAFDWSDDLNTYLRYGVAYRAGGANSRSATFRTFDEEEVETWELGIKSDFFDRRARFNLALYTTSYNDMQVDFISPVNVSVNETLNSTTTPKIRGVEADLTARLARGLTLNGSYVFTDVEMPDQLNPFSGVYQVSRPRYTPKHAGSVALDYEFEPMSFGVLSAHVDWNLATGVYVEPADASKSKGSSVMNGRLTLGEIAIGAGDLSVALWGKNLTNYQYDVFDYPYAAPGLLGADQRSFNEPRTFGVEAILRL